MNVVDSSAWVEYFRGGSQGELFADAVETVDELLVPTVVFLEVYKHILRQAGREAAIRAAAAMQQGALVELDRGLALEAGELGVELGLPLADSIIYATALRHDATLWTQDADFQGLDRVEYRERG